jgi:hypothetical protein
MRMRWGCAADAIQMPRDLRYRASPHERRRSPLGGGSPQPLQSRVRSFTARIERGAHKALVPDLKTSTPQLVAQLVMQTTASRISLPGRWVECDSLALRCANACPGRGRAHEMDLDQQETEFEPGSEDEKMTGCPCSPLTRPPTAKVFSTFKVLYIPSTWIPNR